MSKPCEYGAPEDQPLPMVLSVGDDGSTLTNMSTVERPKTFAHLSAASDWLGQQLRGPASRASSLHTSSVA